MTNFDETKITGLIDPSKLHVEIEETSLQIQVGIQSSGPQGKPGEPGKIWLPTIDENKILSWTQNDGVVPPDPVDLNILLEPVDYDLVKERTIYSHEQAQASTTWLINHNLGYYPSVSTTTYGGTTIIGAIKYIDKNNLTVEFTVEVAGYAHLS